MKKLFLLVCLFMPGLLLLSQMNLPDNFHYDKLGNGMEVLVIEDPSVPLATIELTVRNGAYCETDQFDGLSHLYEHMFFKANRDYPSQDAFMERINELGASFNGTTSTDRVNYFIHLGKDNLEDGLEFMNSAIRYPLFDKEEMKKENVVVDGEFERNESSPVFFLRDELSVHMWGDLYSRKNVIGNHDTIKHATPAKMKIVQEKYYYPNNTLLTVSGDVNRMDVMKLAEKVYGDWKPSEFDPFEKYPIPEFKPLEKSTNFVVENPNVRVPYIMRGWHGPDTRNDVKSTYVADVFSYILQQKTSKFHKAFVDSGLTYGGQLGYYTNKYTGPITFIMVPNPEKVQETLKLMDEHIAMWDQDDYYTDEQLQTAKDLLAIQDAFSREKTSEFTHTVTFWWATADLEYYTNYHKNLQEVTREDIKKYVKKYIQNKKNSTGILVTEEMRAELKLDEFFKVSK